jgi:hypothetical protein
MTASPGDVEWRNFVGRRPPPRHDVEGVDGVLRFESERVHSTDDVDRVACLDVDLWSTL